MAIDEYISTSREQRNIAYMHSDQSDLNIGEIANASPCYFEVPIWLWMSLTDGSKSLPPTNNINEAIMLRTNCKAKTKKNFLARFGWNLTQLFRDKPRFIHNWLCNQKLLSSKKHIPFIALQLVALCLWLWNPDNMKLLNVTFYTFLAIEDQVVGMVSH